MKIYISGPITGVEDYLEKFHEASKVAASEGFTPIDPCTLPHEHDKSYEAYMKEDIKALLECDYIYMLDNWQESKGAMVEYEVAVACGIEQVSF